MTAIKSILYVPLTILSISIHAQEQPGIFIPPLEMVYPDVKELVIARESILPENPVKIEELDYSVHWVCGGVVGVNEELTAQTVLLNAPAIYKFDYLGVFEKWIPINGKSEQFNVYKLRN